jgi:hypothetical protein
MGERSESGELREGLRARVEFRKGLDVDIY